MAFRYQAVMALACALSLAARASTEYSDLTALVRDGGFTPVVAASQQYGNWKAANAFDGVVPLPSNGTTRYNSWATGQSATGWITYEFPADFLDGHNVVVTDVTISMSRYEANDAKRAPASWTLYGRSSSDDEWGEVYVQPTAVTNWNATSMASYSFAIPGNLTFTQYKLDATANNGMASGNQRLHIGEIEFHGYYVTASETEPCAPVFSAGTRGGSAPGTRLVNWDIADYGYLSQSADVFLDYAEGDSLDGAATVQIASGVTGSPVKSGSYLIEGLADGAGYIARVRVTNACGLSASRDLSFSLPSTADLYAGGDLQAALAAAKAEIAGGADSATIRLGPGDYYISAELAIDKAVTIVSTDGPDETCIHQLSANTRVASLTAPGATVSGVTLAGNIFNGNATYNGGIVYLNAVGALATNCVLRGATSSNNSKTVLQGAGAYIDAAGAVVDCTITENSSYRPGFGVYMKGSTSKTDANYWRNSVIRGCRITGNRGYGNNAQGCVYYHYGVVEGCLIANNSADRHPSVGLCPTHNASKTYSFISHCTIVGNSCPHTGAGLATSSAASVTLNDCIVWGNTPTDLIDDNVTFNNCCSPVLKGENGNISSDPLFVDAVNGDYRLRSDSPCAGAGSEGSDIGCFAPVRDGFTATFTMTREWAVSEQEIEFAASAFVDGAAAAADSFAWNFGDGATASGATAMHAYATTGSYEVVMTAASGDDSFAAHRIVNVVTTNETVEVGCDVVAAVKRVCRASEASGVRGTVTLGEGVFELTDQIRLDAPVTVQGTGFESTCVTQRFEMARTAVLYDADGVYSGILFAGGRSNGGGTGIPSEPRHGLGIHMTGGTVTNCAFESMVGGGQNSKVSGGGIKMSAGLVVDCVFRNSSAKGDGGGIYTTGGIVDRCVFTNLVESGTQHTTGNGTAVAIYGAATLRNSLIANNTADYYCAGVFINGGQKATVENCTIAGNTSGTTAGAGLNCGTGTNNKFRNLIIHDNRTGGAVNDVSTPAAATMENCDVSSALANGTGNISADPGFVSYKVEGQPDDFHLAQGSLCVDAGTDSVTDGNVLDLDFVECPQDGDGDSVSVRDMGCYEYTLGGDGLSCLFTLSNDGAGYAGTGLEVEFSSTVLYNGEVVSGDDVYYQWDFGDGTTLRGAGEDYADPIHEFTEGSRMTVTLVVNYNAESADFTRENCVVLYPDMVYVAPVGESEPEFPYATPQTASDDLLTAHGCVARALLCGAPSVEVRLLPGDHVLTSEIEVNGPARIVGMGAAPSDTSVTPVAQSRAFLLLADGARVENLRVTGMNLSTEGLGGAFYVSSDSIVSNVVVESCLGSGHGSNRRGLAFYAKAGLIVDCVVRDCHGNYGYRGGENVMLEGTAIMDRCVIANNYGGGEGGSSGNWSSFGYSGIGASLNGNATLRNSLVVGNRSAYKAGAGVYLAGNANLVNCTVVGNYMVDTSTIGTYEKTAAGVYVSSKTTTIENCVIAENTLADDTQANIGNVLDGVAYTIATEADLDPELGNLSSSPVFKDPENGDWRLVASSPGAGAGRNAEWMDGARDLLGNPRRIGRVDMGCYESPASGTLILVR